jgi:hypothetical protein
MTSLSPRDQRTLRFAAIGIGVYLGLFFGAKGLGRLEQQRADYFRLLDRAQNLKREFAPYETKTLILEKLKRQFRLDPTTIKDATLIADTSSAIQQAAASSGIQLGPLRESPPRTGSRELTSIQLEGVGKVPAVLGLLHQLVTLGYPVMLDTVQLAPAPAGGPGMLKLNLTLLILDWKQLIREEGRNV